MRHRGVRRRATRPRRRPGWPEAAGVPRVRLRRASLSSRTAHLATAKRAGKLVNLETALECRAAARRDGRHRPHPLGDPRRSQRPQRAPAPRRQRPGGRHPQRDHRELRGVAGRARGPRPGVPQRDRHRGRGSSPCRGARHHRRPRRGDAPGQPAPRGRLHPRGRPRRRARRRRRRRAATARWSSVEGRARTSSAPTSPPSSPTRARPSSSGRTRSSSSAGTSITITELRRQPG